MFRRALHLSIQYLKKIQACYYAYTIFIKTKKKRLHFDNNYLKTSFIVSGITIFSQFCLFYKIKAVLIKKSVSIFISTTIFELFI